MNGPFKEQKRSWREAGNAIVMLFAAIGMAGVVTYGLNNVMRGPGVMTAEVSRKTIAENNLVASSRLAINAATNAQGNDGDCDGDGFVEPVPFRTAGVAPAPVGGGLIPMTIGASTTDPWGAQYGYCVWDAGTVKTSDNNAGCGGSSANRLDGGPKDNQPAIAVISAGKNGVFETDCNAYIDANADGKPDTPMVDKPSGSDDVVLSYTYAEANGIGGGEWKLKTADNTTAEVGKNLEIGGGGTFQGPVTLTEKGLVLPGDPGDNSITGACDAGKDQQLRRNTSTTPPSLEICDAAGAGWTGISGGGSAAPADEYFDPNEGNCTANESGSLAQVGTISIPNAADIYSDGSYIYLTQNNAVGVYTFNGNSFVPVTTFGTSASGALKGDGTYIYNVNEASDLLEAWYFNGTTATMIDNVATGNTNEDIWTDGQYVYTATQTQIRAYTFDGADLTLRDTEAVGAFSIWGDGTYIYSVGNNNLVAWTFNGTALTQVGSTAIGADQGAALWGDGTYLYAALRTRLAAFTFDGATFTLEGNNTSIDAFDVWGDGVNVFAPTPIGVYATTFDGSTFTVDSSIPVTHDSFPQLRGDGNFLYSTTGTIGAYSVVALSGYRCTEPPPRNVVYSSYEEDDVGALADALDVGLIAHWPMNEGTGTTVEDTVGTYDGTFVNTPVWSKGPNDDGSLAFNMDDRDGVQITGLMGSQPVGTISLWANIGRSDIGVNPPKQSNLFSIADSVVIATRDYVGVSVYLYQGGATWLALNSGQAIESTGWHYITTTFDDTANIWRLYIDGVMVANSATAMTLTYTGVGTNTFIGRQGNGSANYDYDGGIDDIRMYNRALSPNEVAALYKKVRKESETPEASVIAPAHNSYEGLITNGQDAACGIKLDGAPWCWGWDGSEVLGNGTGTTNQPSPVPVSIPTAQTYYLVTTASGITPGGSPIYSKQLLTEPNVANTPNATAITPGSSNNGYGFTQANVFGKDDGGGPRTYTVTMNFAAANTCVVATVYAARVDSTGTVQGSEVKIGNESTIWSTSVTFTGEANLGAFGFTDRLQIRYNMRNICGANQTPTVNFNQLSTVTVPAIEYPAWTQISTLWNSTCGLRADGTAWCWGQDTNGQLGNGTLFTGTQSVPTPVFNSSAVRWSKISTGGSHACGIKEDGTLWCWGSDSSGQIGDGAGGGGVIPIAVGAATDWVDISAGLVTTCGVRANGDAYCWGADGDGQVGNNAAFADQISPALVVGGPWSQISVRAYHTCAVKTDGSLWCWGDDAYERLGVPATSTDQALPVKIDNGPWTYVATGEFHTCGIKADSTVWCWGRSDNYRLGTSSTTNWPYPVMVPGSMGTVGLESGSTSSCLMKADRSVLCWGSDTLGSIGNGAVTTGDSPPAPVTGFPGKPTWSWNDAATTITPPIGTNVSLNGNYLSSTANNDGLGYIAAGKADLRQIADPSQLLVETTANASAQMSFTNDATVTPPVDYLTGLVGRWQFNDGSGTTAADSSGNGNTFTLGAGASTRPTWTTGAIDGALDFDGTDDYLTRVNSASLNIATTVTLMAWVKMDAIQSNFTTILGKLNTNITNNQYRMGIYQDVLVFDFCSAVSAACTTYNSGYTDPATLQAGKWYHLAITFNNTSNSAKLFINGVQATWAVDQGDINNGNMRTTTQPLYVGYGIQTDPYFDGQIDELRVYNTELTPAQVTAVYNYTLGSYYGPKAFTMGVDNTTNNFEIGRDVIAATNWLSAINPDIAITQTGRMGVGTASPAVKMDVSGGVKFGAESYCTTGRDGAIRYVSGNYEYCDGTNWVHLGGGGSGGGGGGGPTGDLTSGLLHHWKLDEAVPGPYVDAVGSSNCTNSGATTSVAGKSNNALDFNATGIASCGVISDMNGLTKLTWSAWLKVDTATTDHLAVGAVSGSGGANSSLNLNYWDDGNVFCQLNDTGGGAAWDEGYSPLNSTAWHLITCVYDGTQSGNANRLKMYVDGAPVALTFGSSNIPASIPNQTNTWRIGPYAGGDSDGVVDDVRIYNKALTATEVGQVYACTGGTGSCTSTNGDAVENCTGLGDGAVLNDATTGHCYYNWTGGMVFADAQAACQADGAYVFVPDNQSETDAVAAVFGEGWAGFSDDATEDTWVYTDGPKAGQTMWQGDGGGYPVNNNYVAWNPGEPSNTGGAENCGAFMDDGNWIDNTCFAFYGAICEKGSSSVAHGNWRSPSLKSYGFYETLSAGWGITAAIAADGTAWTWGPPWNGVLGNNDSGTQRNTPVPVHSSTSFAGYKDWLSITASTSADYNCGLRANGTAWCWGDNTSGNLGDGTTTPRSRPTQVRGVGNTAPYTDWIQIGGKCGVRASGVAYCWGEGSNGENGNGASSDVSSPVVVSGGYTDWLMVSAGVNISCGLRANGTLWCWGNGLTAGARLGDGSTNTASNVPVQVHDLDGAGTAPTNFTDWIYVSVGNRHACGIRANHLAYCWGYGVDCQLGDTSCSTRTRPYLVQGGYTDWTNISAGVIHTCGLRANGTAWCWGQGVLGRLGVGNDIDSGVPEQVMDADGSSFWTDWVSISAGDEHSCGQLVDGSLWCWGKAADGSLGSNDITGPYNLPQFVR